MGLGFVVLGSAKWGWIGLYYLFLALSSILFRTARYLRKVRSISLVNRKEVLMKAYKNKHPEFWMIQNSGWLIEKNI